MNICKNVLKIFTSAIMLSFLITCLLLTAESSVNEITLLITQPSLNIKQVISSGAVLGIIIIILAIACALIMLIIFSLLDIIFNNNDIIEIITGWRYTLKGDTGPVGMQGPKGDRGESIYDIYRRLEGNENKTEEEFINDMAISIAEYMKEQEITKEEKTNESC